jgi:hypothetical protein
VFAFVDDPATWWAYLYGGSGDPRCGVPLGTAAAGLIALAGLALATLALG